MLLAVDVGNTNVVFALIDGATIVAVPAAFTAATGPAHWELLLRARAVEDQVFVIGAGQVGTLPPGMPRCHGHSMIVDPWGVVLAERTDPDPGIVVADLDLAARAVIKPDDLLWVVVGDAAKVEPQLRNLGLPVEKMTAGK